MATDTVKFEVRKDKDDWMVYVYQDHQNGVVTFVASLPQDEFMHKLETGGVLTQVTEDEIDNLPQHGRGKRLIN